jgi:phosphoribosylanthranilate isomerase
MGVRIKICGITTTGDVDLLAALGVDSFGLMFHARSPRALDVARAAELARRAAGRIVRVGVFVDAPRTEVCAVLDAVELDEQQFHGDEDDAYCRAFGLPYIKVVRVRERVSAAALSERYPGAAALLLDAYEPDRHGGTGRSFDWALWPEDAAGRPVYLSGGLGPDNVARAIRATDPYGVDASTGLEAGVPGIKDPARLRKFVEEVQRAGEG